MVKKKIWVQISRQLLHFVYTHCIFFKRESRNNRMCMSDHRRVRSRDVGDGGLLHQPLLAPLRFLRLLTSTHAVLVLWNAKNTQPLFFFDDDDLFFVTRQYLYNYRYIYNSSTTAHNPFIRSLWCMTHHCWRTIALT